MEGKRVKREKQRGRERERERERKIPTSLDVRPIGNRTVLWLVEITVNE